MSIFIAIAWVGDGSASESKIGSVSLEGWYRAGVSILRDTSGYLNTRYIIWEVLDYHPICFCICMGQCVGTFAIAMIEFSLRVFVKFVWLGECIAFFSVHTNPATAIHMFFPIHR